MLKSTTNAAASIASTATTPSTIKAATTPSSITTATSSSSSASTTTTTSTTSKSLRNFQERVSLSFSSARSGISSSISAGVGVSFSISGDRERDREQDRDNEERDTNDDQDVSARQFKRYNQQRQSPSLIDPYEQAQLPRDYVDPEINSAPPTKLHSIEEYQKFTDPQLYNRLSVFRNQLIKTKMSAYSTTNGPPPGAIPPPPHGAPSQIPQAPHSGGMQHNPGGGAPVPDSYFTESRKGEVNELRNLLRNFGTERDPQRKREIIKKVIAYMTLGIDVSRLFTEMMLAIETRDLVIKKMVYLFLCNYATTHPELAQMCTNTLVKDCGNDDPMVRGLALRSLCSLRLAQMVEYISEPLRRALTDGHAYVRKTGVMGILKLYHLDREAFDRCNFSDILYDMLRDPDANVVTNCIIVLNEVMQDSGGMAINRAIMLHLLNRIHEFSEFGIIQVMELIPRYIPANEDEGYQIMNLLDPVLRTSNSGAVLATIRAFMSIAEQGDDADSLKRQVVSRIKAPFVTQISSGSSELVYCLIQNVDALVDMCPGIFDDEYRQFYIKHSDPTHVKYLKVNLLPKLANPDNAPDIVSELSELVNDSDVHLSRLCVRSMTRIACRNVGGPGCEQSVARRLVEMLDLTVDHVCSEAATALTHLVRKHPSLKEAIAPPLARSLKYVTEASGRASIIYLLGECGAVVPEAPYALEKLIDTYDTLTDPNVKSSLLSATVKLFFMRPPEVQKMLGRLLSKVTDDVSSQDLHDRGLFYYRMLQAGDASVVQSAIATDATLPPTQNFTEDDDSELRHALMREFNTLSITYGQTSDHFIAEHYQVPFVQLPPEHPLAPGAEHSTAASSFGVPAPAAGIPGGGYAETTASNNDDGLVDLLGFGGGGAPPPAPAPVGPPTTGFLQLKSVVSMSGDEYQSTWGSIPDAEAIVSAVPVGRMPTCTDDIETKLTQNFIFTMASGELPAEFKFFLYAQEETTGDFFLIQSNLNKNDPLLILTIKATTTTGASAVATKVEQLTEIIQGALS